MDMNGLRLTPHQIIFEDENNITVVFPNGTEYTGYCVCVSGGGLTGASGADGSGSSSGTIANPSSSVEYYDEDSLIATNPTKINFIGLGVCAISPDNGNTVDVYVPCPEKLSHFNSFDGNCDARLIDPVTYLRHISSPYSILKLSPCGTPTLGNYIDIKINTSIRPLTNFDYFVFKICFDKNGDHSEFEEKEYILVIRNFTELSDIISESEYLYVDGIYQFKIVYNISTSRLTITSDCKYVSSFLNYNGYYDEYDALLDSYLFSSQNDAAYKTFDIGDWVPETLHETINDSIIVYNTSCPIIFENGSNFVVYIYDWKKNIIGQNFIANLVGDLIAVKEGISVNIHDWSPSVFTYSAIVDISINISKTLPNGGRFSIFIEQENPSGTNYTYSSHDIFYDPNLINPTFSNVSLDPIVETIKWTSGVARYTLGTKFDIIFVDLMNLNNSSYPDNFLTVDLSDYMLPNKLLNPSDIIGWINLWSYSSNPARVNSGYDINTPDVFFENPNGRIKATWTDWITSPVISGSPFPMLIDTLSPISTDLAEEFVDESFRLLPDLSDYRDPTILLNDDELQVLDNVLIRRSNFDYTIYNPVNTAKYTANYNNQYYYREFKSSNVSYYNGLLNLGGILKESIIKNKEILIDISLDGINWFSCNNDFLGNPILSNGDGCRINKDSVFLPDLQFTLGGKPVDNSTGSNKTHQLTGNSHYGLFVRICFTPNFNGQLDHIRIIDWK